MKRALLTALSFALLAGSARAEVIIDRSKGGADVVSTPSATGPWGVVNPAVFADDRLNADGDIRRDGQPDIVLNRASGREDIIWLDGKTDQVRFAAFDGWGWSEVITVSASSAQSPELTTDSEGNRFVVWARDGSKDPVYFNALAHDDYEQIGTFRLSQSNDRISAPSVVFHEDEIYVAYNGQEQGGDGNNYVSVDRVRVVRDGQGRVTTNGGADAPAIDETLSRMTHMPPSGNCQPIAHSQSGHLWVDWIDKDGRMGWSEKYPGGDFGPSQFIQMEGGIAQSRRTVRQRVLSD